MSRYLVDKFLFNVDRDPDLLRRYEEDPAGFVAWWEENQGPRLGPVERTSAHAFTAEERTALAQCDYEALYAMGAHPFLLLTLMIPVYEHDHPDFREFARVYTAKTRPHGRPRFDT